MPGSAEQLRLINTEAVRAALKNAPGSTKADIAAASGLSHATCNTILNELAASGEVLEVYEKPAGSGRPATRFHYNGEFGHLLCASLTNDDHRPAADVAVYNLLGQRKLQKKFSFKALGPGELEAMLFTLLSDFPRAKAVCIGVPGVVEPGGRIGEYCDLPGLRNCKLSEDLQAALHVPVLLDNDMNLAVIGYSHYKGLRQNATVAALYYPKGNYPGTGLLADGHLLHGQRGFAGEVAWLPFMPRGKPPGEDDDMAAIAGDTILSLMAVLNPGHVLLSGSLLSARMLPEITSRCANVAPPPMQPDIQFEADIGKYTLLGLLHMAQQSLVYTPDWS